MKYKFNIGDTVNNGFFDHKIAALGAPYNDDKTRPAYTYTSSPGAWDYESSLTLVKAAAPPITVPPAKVPPKLDLTKPVQTQDGRAVRVLCVDAAEPFSVIGLVEGNSTPCLWTVEGRYFSIRAMKCAVDLVNVPEKPVSATETVRLHLHRHRETGRVRVGAKNRPKSLLWEHLGFKVVEITITEGDGLSLDGGVIAPSKT
jgi:hypothetical protein